MFGHDLEIFEAEEGWGMRENFYQGWVRRIWGQGG